MSFRMIVPLALIALLLSAWTSSEPETTATIDASESSLAGQGTGPPGTETREPDKDSPQFIPLPQEDDPNSNPNGNITVQVLTAPAEWPENAPAFAPSYPGGTIITASVSTSFNGKTLPGASFSTTDAPAKVFDYYKPLAIAAGLTEALMPETPGIPGMSSFAAIDAKGDVALLIQAGTTDGTTYVTIYFSRPG